MMSLRAFHRTTGVIVATFVVAHVANHLSALAGIAAHLDFMERLRTVYRHPAVEAALLLCVLLQAATGLWLVLSGWRRRTGLIAWLQAASGAYLALFLLIHVVAILYGRASLGLDTNVHYAAAGLHAGPMQYFFVPYYFLALVAVFAHLGCALSWHVRARGMAVAVPVCVGTVLASLVLAALMGKMYPYEVPQKYRDTWRQS